MNITKPFFTIEKGNIVLSEYGNTYIKEVNRVTTLGEHQSKYNNILSEYLNIVSLD